MTNWWNWNWNVRILWRWILENHDDSLLLLADNYRFTANDPTTEAQSAQRTHKEIDAVSTFIVKKMVLSTSGVEMPRARRVFSRKQSYVLPNMH